MKAVHTALAPRMAAGQVHANVGAAQAAAAGRRAQLSASELLLRARGVSWPRVRATAARRAMPAAARSFVPRLKR